MNNYFECTIKYSKVQQNGQVKKVSEKYLVDSLSFTEAEAKIIKESQSFISGEFNVSDIKRSKVSEVFDANEGDKYYDFKLAFITIDEKSAKEKKTFSHILVLGDDIDGAKIYLDERMKGTLSDYVVDTIKETKIVDVYINQ